MAGQQYVHDPVGPALHMNYFATVLGRLPSSRCQVLASRVEGFDIDIFDGRADVGETPCDALVVSHNHVGKSWQSDAGSVEVAAGTTEMRFVPQVRHLVPQVHVVRE